jgi:4-methyl-5(b-hydroxyethyl)-thiazole monophosphate biosynthesis
MNVIVPLAHGFEEIEAVTIIDLLRRAGINVTTAYLGENPVSGAHNIIVNADINIKEAYPADFGCIALPGGMPGSNNLKENSSVISMVKEISKTGGIVSAICAAPIVLGRAGVLSGRKAVCFPGFENELNGAVVTNSFIEVDNNIVTGKGPGCAILFSLKLIELISGKKNSDIVKDSLQICC